MSPLPWLLCPTARIFQVPLGTVQQTAYSPSDIPFLVQPLLILRLPSSSSPSLLCTNAAPCLQAGLLMVFLQSISDNAHPVQCLLGLRFLGPSPPTKSASLGTQAFNKESHGSPEYLNPVFNVRNQTPIPPSSLAISPSKDGP